MSLHSPAASYKPLHGLYEPKKKAELACSSVLQYASFDQALAKAGASAVGLERT